EPVAIIVAKERYIAEDLVSLVDVEYDPLPVAIDPEKTLDPDAPKLYDDWNDNLLKRAVIKGGDIEKALSEADIVIKERFRTHRLTAAPIENRGVIAQFDRISQKLNVWSQVQFPHVGRTIFAKIFNVSEDKIHFQMPDVGGSFGLKGHIFPEDVSVCAAARRHNRSHVTALTAGMRESGFPATALCRCSQENPADGTRAELAAVRPSS
ncbi:MAG: molybdopterin cofactor-binding domain-containing protein, partial [Acetobacteraceae bacterium]